MGVYTNIEFRNANDPDFINARDGTAEERQYWEDDNGPMNDRPGALLDTTMQPDTAEAITETNDEYGGWIIELAKIPPNTTHIVVHRG
mgnify:CR=1 FL=1